MLRRFIPKRRPAGPPLAELKLRAIDFACQELSCRSLADLGGVWAVDGGYACYALDRYGLNRVVICDDDFTPALLERARRERRLELIRGNFGRSEIAGAVGSVDAVVMFDVLLHQVRPDWDEVIKLYAGSCRAMVVAGPWWTGAGTIRLLDLGREAYLDAVPLREFHEEVWEKLDQINPRRGRAWRDCHDIWQWGITEQDLTATMRSLGFELRWREERGRWRGLEQFGDRAFVFARERPNTLHAFGEDPARRPITHASSEGS